MKITYEWSWKALALFRCTKEDDGSGSSWRLFTLRPDWLAVSAWRRLRYGPDPFVTFEKWLKKNGHFDDADFMRAVCWWYANHSEPGQLARLNPKLLK